MFLRSIDLTTALRPSLLPDETLLFVQDAVGLYQGRFKIPDYQNGQAYLTSHRACYVDNDDPRNKAVAVSLKDVDHVEFYAGFLKSSPKVTFYPKAAKHLSSVSRPAPSPHSNGLAPVVSSRSQQASPRPQSYTPPRSSVPSNATWICPICSFANPVPVNFDTAAANENTPLPPCLACGIKPPLMHVVKAALASISSRPSSTVLPASWSTSPLDQTNGSATPNAPSMVSDGDPGESRIPCPRCTFANHPSLAFCEMCSAALTTTSRSPSAPPSDPPRTESPGPFLGNASQIGNDATDSVKFSFRLGGGPIFHDRLKGALVQRKWLLQSAPVKPQYSTSTDQPGTNTSSNVTPTQKNIGISGLERRDLAQRKNNEVVIGNAFEDLAALMASAKEIIALAEQFNVQVKGTPGADTRDGNADAAKLLSQLNLTTTREMLGGGAASSSANSLYMTELSRQLAEFLTDDTSGVGVLKSAGGIISLVDLWSVFNRARGGVELVSPTDFANAAELFEKLRLPVRLRKFKSGLLVVQGADRTDEKTVRAVTGWLEDLRQVPPEVDVAWDWITWGRGVTAVEVAERFGWSVGVASEELEMAEEKGALCREVGVEGVKFWINWFLQGQVQRVDASKDSVQSLQAFDEAFSLPGSRRF